MKELKKFLTKKVRAIKIKTPKKISQLLEEMKRTGFQGRKLAEVTEIWEKMIKDKNVTIFFGYTGSLSTTGQWKIINWLIENHFIDVLVSTGANISEDIVGAMGKNYWQGHHLVQDDLLFKVGLNRYYDVYGREDDYLEMTELIADFIMTLKEKYNYSSREFLFLFGQWLWQKGIKSIVATAAKNKVPVFCPAIVDSPYGDAGLLAKSRGFNLILDNMKDYFEFMKLAEQTKETAVIYIGGGVPKDFIQLLAVTSDLLYKDKNIPGKKGRKRLLTNESYYPHKYAIQITTDSPQWGGLSGATLDEGVSWGKELPAEGNYAQCYCDATIALPIIAQALAERKLKRKGRILTFED
ncbi:MAG: deoxyhypusine synthase family protein [Patescibacteria group bacterium]|nr:deoxyhypusine synthase family protein [Patescibacteria group bacterium]